MVTVSSSLLSLLLSIDISELLCSNRYINSGPHTLLAHTPELVHVEVLLINYSVCVPANAGKSVLYYSLSKHLIKPSEVVHLVIIEVFYMVP